MRCAILLESLCVGVMCGMEGEMCNTIGFSACLLEECVEWRVRCAILLDSLRVIVTNRQCHNIKAE